jgi:nucleoside-diphosphate-sugar epimerase
MQRVLVTGATGLVGSEMCARLAGSGYQVRAALRAEAALPACIAERVIVGDIAHDVDWRPALADVHAVVHAAAHTHVRRAQQYDRDLYEAVNVRATYQLAQSAADLGVERFVYLSSIKVNGEATSGQPYAAGDHPDPRDCYGRSKLRAETCLMQAAARSGMQVAIVRPPLVYGPGVRANFLRLMRWVDSQRPLPLGAIRNQRSLVSVGNLCDLIATLLATPRPQGTWLVSDGEDLSTPELIRRLADAMQRTARLIAVPVPLLRLCAAMAGRSAEAARLCGSLQVSMAATCEALGWSPPVRVDEALARTVTWYRAHCR